MRLLPGLALLLVACPRPAPAPPVPEEALPLLARAHAHNDYDHSRPLQDALAAGFHSLEADVYFAGGRFDVSHHGVFPKGTLEALYLRPLQERVDQDGVVQPGGAPFTLWIDLKDGDPALVETLHALLDGFPMLTVFDDQAGVTPGPVTAVLTGNAQMKEAFVQGRSRRRAIRDSNDFSPEDPPADARWGYYALKWDRYVDWDGRGTIPPEQSERLAAVVNQAHAKGRQVRFWGGPDRVDLWRAWVDHDVDFLHTDDLDGLSTYLRLRSDAGR